MFADRKATLMLPAKDIERAKRWYEEKLGIVPAGSGEYELPYTLGGGLSAAIYKSDFAGTAQNTVISFSSDDLVADMAALRGKGVVFEDYDLPGLKTVNGIAEFGTMKVAWAKDSEGNILGFTQAG